MSKRVYAGVAVFIRNRSGKILFTRRAKVEMPDKWSIPGGAILPGESPKDTMHREVASEVGVRISEIGEPDQVMAYTYPNGEHHIILFYRATAWLADECKLVHRDYEITWLERDEFPSYEEMLPPLDAAVKRMIVRCAV